MLIPAKHITFSESLLGLGSYVLSALNTPQTLDEIWIKYQEDISHDEDSFKHSFDNLTLTIIFLYSIGKVIEQNGKLEKI
jgi:hypothetical protein